MEREEVASPMVIMFKNCPTHAKAEGGKKTAKSLFTTKARSALKTVTEPLPKNNFQKLDLSIQLNE